MTGSHHKKILVIEDDKDFSEVLQIRLENMGFKVVVLFDGTEALNVVKTESPDLILLDIFLPEMDGFTTLKSLKAEKIACADSERLVSDIPIVVMTGKAPMMDETVRFEGACEFLTKPFDVDSLIRRITQIVNEKEAK